MLETFFSACRGNVAVTVAIAALPMAVLTGSAVDLANLHNARRTAQSALDAAVLAGATAATFHNADPEKDARAVWETNVKAMKDGLRTRFELASITNQDGVFSGRATATRDLTFGPIIGLQTQTISVASAASTTYAREPLCFMAMHPTRKHTLELKETVDVIAPDCHIYGNSSDRNDVVDPHTRFNFMVAKSIQAIGYGHHYIENLTPPLEYAPELIPDPLATMAIPTKASCDFNNHTLGSGSHTLEPGKYCGGLKISNARVTLEPGTYIVSGGKIEFNNSEVRGDGVTLVMNDMDTELEWKDTEFEISAPKNGPLKSMALISQRVPTYNEFEDSIIDIHGVVYIPEGVFKWRNKGTYTVNHDWTAWIVDGVTWTGDGVVPYNFKTAGSDVPYPSALSVIPRPGIRLVR